MTTTKRVKFFVTGFGPFMGVDQNPTQSLVEYLSTGAANEEMAPVQVRAQRCAWVFQQLLQLSNTGSLVGQVDRGQGTKI